jgi:hypothetical protein
MKQTNDYSLKIERDGRTWCYTVKVPDGKIAVREAGFFKREAAVAQAQAAILDLKTFRGEEEHRSGAEELRQLGR